MKNSVQMFLKVFVLACIFASFAHADAIDVSGRGGTREYQSYLNGLSNTALTLEVGGQQAKIALSCAASGILLPINAVAESIPIVAAPATFWNLEEYSDHYRAMIRENDAFAVNAAVGTLGLALGETVANVWNAVSALDYKPLFDYSGTRTAGYSNTREIYYERFVDDHSMCLQSQVKLRMAYTLAAARRLHHIKIVVPTDISGQHLAISERAPSDPLKPAPVSSIVSKSVAQPDPAIGVVPMTSGF